MKTYYLLALLVSTSYVPSVMAQNQPVDSLEIQQNEVLEEIIVRSVRATANTPVAFSNLNKEELKKRNLGQDIPVLMNYLPSVVSTTDAGHGIGYTSLRVRGSDATRINVTLNGIPYNDSESHGSFWVNMPDFASSTENFQLQRGVGTSTNGSGAFGASLNILTDGFSHDPYVEVANSFGSFNSRKHTLKFSSGLINNNFELQGRISKLNSDGYIDRSWADMSSYFLQGTFLEKNTLIKALLFGGKQKTYQAWNGLEQKDIDKYGRRFNTSGLYFDENGNMHFYDNETDNYKQDHYQLHWNERWSEKWSTNLALHYTKGFGYFENYKSDESLADYGLSHPTIESTDLIRRKYLDNDFYGFTFSTHYNQSNFDVIVGGAANWYKGDHFGEIFWVKEPIANTYKQQYYFDNSTKSDVNGYAKATWTSNDWSFYGDVQLRNVKYTANGEDTGIIDDNFTFFNPKAGVTYSIDEHQKAYFSYAKAHREPNRNDYENGNPKPEKLNDFELGWRYAKVNSVINVNFYYMRYKDQLVLTGALNDVGAPLRENSGDSYRAGVEIDAQIKINDKWLITPTVSVSKNENIDYHAQIDGVLQNLDNTPIAFSPNVILGNGVTYSATKNMHFTWLSKYVGEQYMGNTKSDFSKLDAYFTNDLVFSYTIKPNKYLQQIDFNLMLNNIFNVKYISNGYYYTYDDNWSTQGQISTIEGAGYYPQAQFHLFGGVTLKF